MQPVGTFIRANENSLSGLNGLFVRVLIEVDLRLPLKRVMVINDQEDCPVLLSYEKLFEVCFYYGRRRSEGHKCPTLEDKHVWLLVDRLFEDKSLVYPTGAEISEETRQELHRGVMLVFPQPVVGEEVNAKDEEELELRYQARSCDKNVSEGWTTVASRKSSVVEFMFKS
ncbi:hypothetical protein ACFX1Q_030020 [Malus domestica]